MMFFDFNYFFKIFFKIKTKLETKKVILLYCFNFVLIKMVKLIKYSNFGSKHNKNNFI